MIDMKSCAAAHRNHFQGNGNCDATREANKREDHMTGMESEIAPYYGGESNAGSSAASGTENGMLNHAGNNAGNNTVPGAMGQMTPYGGVWNAGGGAQNTMTAYGAANTAAAGYNDPEFGPEHEWTSEEEDGMNSLPQDNFDDPLSADEAARNSWRALLARNVGRSVLVRFLMGTQNLITVEGELYEVGTDYIVIYQPLWDSHITADLYSVKFVEFREPPGQTTLA